MSCQQGFRALGALTAGNIASRCHLAGHSQARAACPGVSQLDSCLQQREQKALLNRGVRVEACIRGTKGNTSPGLELSSLADWALTSSGTCALGEVPGALASREFQKESMSQYVHCTQPSEKWAL